MSTPVEVRRENGVPVARLVGEIDLTRATVVRAELLDAVSNQDHGLVLDLRDTTYLDSAGVNILFELAERLGSRQQRLAGVMPDRAVIGRVLSLVNIRSVMSLHADLEEATSALRPAGPAQS